ncbi:carbohydrate sulfotransferase 1-like [Glandiceps talaboti]
MTTEKAKYLNSSKTENHTLDVMTSLPEQGLSILVVAAFRTGSTFLSQLFNKNKDVFYLFEPLRLVQDMTKAKVITLDLGNSSQIETLSSIYKCLFTSQYVHHMRTWSMAKTSDVIKRLCSKHTTCGNVTVEDMTQTCKNHRHIATKVIRLTSLPILQNLVTEQKLNLKVLHLIRDPRGVVSSRKFMYKNKIEALKNKTIQEAGLVEHLKQYCQRVSEMVKYSRTLPSWLHGRYKIVRYEDVAMDPTGGTEGIYHFLGMSLPVEVSRWISENTKFATKTTSNMATKKNSTEAAQSWRSKLLFEDVKIVQSLEFCSEMMDLMEYKMLNTEDEMKNFTYSTF